MPIIPPYTRVIAQVRRIYNNNDQTSSFYETEGYIIGTIKIYDQHGQPTYQFIKNASSNIEQVSAKRIIKVLSVPNSLEGQQYLLDLIKG